MHQLNAQCKRKSAKAVYTLSKIDVKNIKSEHSIVIFVHRRDQISSFRIIS